MLTKRSTISLLLIATVFTTSALVPFTSNAQDDTSTSDPDKKTERKEVDYGALLQARLTQAIERKEAAELRIQKARETNQARLTQAMERNEEREQRSEDRNAQNLENFQSRLTQQLDRVIEHLELLKERINNSRGLSDDAKAAATAEVDAYIAQVTSLQAEIENAETIDDLRTLSDEAKELWQGYNQQHLGYIGLHLVGRFQDFIDRVGDTANRVESHLAVLSEQYPDIDLSGIESALAEFETTADQAQTAVTEAEQLFNSINADNENNRETYQQGITKLREAKQTIHEASATLRDAIAEVKILIANAKDMTS